MMRRGIEPFTLQTTQAGTVAVFPLLTFAAGFVAQQHYSMIGVDLAATISNPNVPPAGFFVVVGTKQPEIAVDLNTRIVAQLVAGAGAIFNKSEWCGFGDYVIDVPSGCPVSLYVCGGVLNPGQPLIAVATIHLIPEE